MDPELKQVGVQLAASAIRNTAANVLDRIRLAKTRTIQTETIAELEAIVNDLISDKHELIGIAKAYQETLVAQQITDEEIAYIVESVVPVLEEMAGESATGATLSQIKSLISADAVKVLQILGFNFRKAVGEPLTELARSAILANAAPAASVALELQKLGLEREIALANLAGDADAYARLMRLYGRE